MSRVFLNIIFIRSVKKISEFNLLVMSNTPKKFRFYQPDYLKYGFVKAVRFTSTVFAL